MGCPSRRIRASLLPHTDTEPSVLSCPTGPSEVPELYCNQLLLPCCKDH